MAITFPRHDDWALREISVTYWEHNPMVFLWPFLWLATTVIIVGFIVTYLIIKRCGTLQTGPSKWILVFSYFEISVSILCSLSVILHPILSIIYTIYFIWFTPLFAQYQKIGYALVYSAMLGSLIILSILPPGNLHAIVEPIQDFFSNIDDQLYQLLSLWALLVPLVSIPRWTLEIYHKDRGCYQWIIQGIKAVTCIFLVISIRFYFWIEVYIQDDILITL